MKLTGVSRVTRVVSRVRRAVVGVRIAVLTILESVMRTTRVREWESMLCVDTLNRNESGLFNAEVTF